MNFALALTILAADPTAGWVSKSLNSIGKDKFKFEAKIKVPPKAKLTVSRFTVGDEPGGAIAYVELEGGVRVMLMERDAKQTVDPKYIEMQKQLVTWQGTLVSERVEKTWYVFVAAHGSEITLQGANWTVAPGFNCGTKEPVTKEQAEIVVAICGSLSK